VARSKKTGGEIGVLLCNCRGELKKRLDFARLGKELKKLDGVSDVKICSELCGRAACSDAAASFREAGTDRIIIGGCNSEGSGAQVADAPGKTDADRGIWWSVNIYEHCALVHGKKRDATEKVLRRMRAAVERMKLAEPMKSVSRNVRQNVAVVGSGVSGLQAAVSLEMLGHAVSLIHGDKELGGTAASMPELFGHVAGDGNGDGDSVRLHIDGLVRHVKKSRNIHVYPETLLRSVEGERGDFLLALASDGEVEQIRVGAVVLATGSNRIPALDSGDFEKAANLVDLSGLHDIIRSGNVPHRIAIVMDIVGEQDRTVSSLVLSSAFILAHRFHSRVTLFCTNVRVAATGMESLYRKARDAGVIIVKSDTKPTINPGSTHVSVVFDDPITSSTITEKYDMAVIADYRRPETGEDLAGSVKMLKAGPDDVLQYDNIWLLPVQTNRPGIYVIGGARGNSEYREASTDGMAVVMDVHDALKDKRIRIREDSAIVDSGKCVLCLTCLRLCPHGAVSIDGENNAASVSLVTCQRCGICVSECPANAITLPGFTDEQIRADVGENPLVTVFACENSAIPAADAAGLHGYEYGSDIEIITIPCAGRIDPRAVLGALERGAERVLVLGCHPESCKYLTGSSRSEKRLHRLRTMLENAGADPSRVTFGGISAVEPLKFIEYVTAEASLHTTGKAVKS